MAEETTPDEVPIEPFFAEAVGRLNAIMSAAMRRYDLTELRNPQGAPFRFVFDLDMGTRFGISRRGDHFAVRIGLAGVRRLAAMCEQIAAAVVMEEGDGYRIYPCVTLDRISEMDAFVEDRHLAAWRELADTCERPFAFDVVRGYLVEAALTFLVHHELAHGRLGHVDATSVLLPGLVLEEGEVSRRLSFTGALQGMESASDVVGFHASLRELVERDVFTDIPDRLWASGNIRFSLRLVGCFLVPLLWHGTEGETSDHPPPLARFLAMASLGLDMPDEFPTRFRAGFDPALRNAFAIMSNAGRRLTWITPMWDIAPRKDFARIRTARLEAKQAMADVVTTAERYEYTEPLPMSTDQITLSFKDISPATAERLADAEGSPAGVALEHLTVDGELGDGRSSLVLGAVMAIATGIPSGVAANWVWQRMNGDQASVQVIVVNGTTCEIGSADALAAALDRHGNRGADAASAEAGTASRDAVARSDAPDGSFPPREGAQNSRIEVEAAPEEVRRTLEAALTADELDMLVIRGPARDPFSPEPLNDLPTVQAVVEFAAAAIAGGVLHDGVKTALKKAARVLKDRYGEKARAQR